MPPELKDFLNKDRADQIGTVVKVGTNVKSAYNVFQTVIGSVVFFLLGLFFFIFVHKLIGLGIIVVGIILPTVAIASRRKEMGLLNRATPTPTVVQTVTPDETISGFVGGVTALGKGTMTIAILGSGELGRPDNAIVVTNKNIWFVYVPAPGSDVITASMGNTAQETDFLIAKGAIEEKLKEIINQSGLQGVVNTSAKNHALKLSDIGTVEKKKTIDLAFLNKKGIGAMLRFTDKQGEKLTTYEMSEENANKIVSLLQGRVQII